MVLFRCDDVASTPRRLGGGAVIGAHHTCESRCDAPAAQREERRRRTTNREPFRRPVGRGMRPRTRRRHRSPQPTTTRTHDAPSRRMAGAGACVRSASDPRASDRFRRSVSGESRGGQPRNVRTDPTTLPPWPEPRRHRLPPGPPPPLRRRRSAWVGWFGSGSRIGAPRRCRTAAGSAACRHRRACHGRSNGRSASGGGPNPARGTSSASSTSMAPSAGR